MKKLFLVEENEDCLFITSTEEISKNGIYFFPDGKDTGALHSAYLKYISEYFIEKQYFLTYIDLSGYFIYII